MNSLKFKVKSLKLKTFTRYSEKGVALMMVLWILVLLSIVAMNFSFSTRWSTASTRNLKEETMAYYLCMRGYQEAINYLVSDKDPVVDLLDNEGNLRIDNETSPVTGKKTTTEGEIDIRITDEDSKLNINYAGDRLEKLFEYVGMPTGTARELIDSILDWIDRDNKHHLSGAEDEYYEELDNPYKAKNNFFDVPEELLLVKGMRPEYMTGSDEIKAIGPLITTFGKRGDIIGAININTVSKEVMELLGLTPPAIETILKQRESGGFKTIPLTFRIIQLTKTNSSYFRIEVVAHVHGSNRASRIISVVNRTPTDKGFKIRTVYWKENAEGYRG
ncbi:MAG: general secretion pathway protein GspK [Nitrospira sp.]|nr:general secretion pathway protein GspK [Nitrospira sp.]